MPGNDAQSPYLQFGQNLILKSVFFCQLGFQPPSLLKCDGRWISGIGCLGSNCRAAGILHSSTAALQTLALLSERDSQDLLSLHFQTIFPDRDGANEGQRCSAFIPSPIHTTPPTGACRKPLYLFFQSLVLFPAHFLPVIISIP